MAISLDNQFALRLKSLQLSEHRLQLLASNVANADTPGYKARDLDFRAAMQSANTGQMRMTTTQNGHINSGQSTQPGRAQYRVPTQPSLDGNTVDSQLEAAAVGETTIRYQATLTFLNQKIQGLMMAINGGR